MSAPSFSSFPPSFSSFPDLESGTNDVNASDKPKKEKKHKTRRTSREKDSKDRHHKSERNRQREKQEPKTSLSHHTGDHEHNGTNRLFYSDSQGDKMNIQYGGLHAGDVPRYRMVAGGRNVLGLPKGLVILRRVGKGVEVGPESHRKAASLSTSASQALLSRPPSRHFVPSSGSRRYEEVDGYIAFPSKTKDDQNVSYRSISQKDRNNSDDSTSSETDSEYDSDGSDGPPILSAHQETLKKLQQEVELNPDSIKTWLLLLDQTLSTVPITSKNARKARSEISLSVLSRALSASPQNAKDKHLRLAYLRAGEEIWHESKLRSEWDDALKFHDIEIYMEWLEWTIRKGQTGVDEIVEGAVKMLKRVNSESDKIRIFWRVATAIKMAGYTERATAMFQAQAELSFHLPSALHRMAFQSQLDELGEFWDSEHPRLGEDGAKGWDVWYSTRTEYNTASNAQTPTQSQIIDLDPYRQWAAQELESDRKMLVPLRSDTESLDPYSTILFLDIRPVMINITSPEAKHNFRLAWLSFLGLSLPGFSLGADRALDWDDRWNLGYLTTPHILDSIFPLDSRRNQLSTDSVAGVMIGREREYSIPFGPVRCWGKDVCGPLDLDSAHPGKILGRGLWSKEDLVDIDQAFIERILLQLKFPGDDAEWNKIALAFETARNPRSATKQSKSLLSANQASLALWNSHAQLERLRGRPGDARTVYQTILVSAKANKSSHNVGEMWWNWAEMEWLYGDDQQAMDVVLRAADMEGPRSGVTILRAKRALDDLAALTKSSNLWKDHESWIKLRALLELLGRNEPEELFAVFDRYSSSAPNSHSESLVTASLVMVYCHGIVLKRPMAPSILRDRAHLAFDQYPSNSIILGILLEAERGQGVWGRVRSMLGGTDGKTKDVSRRVEEVWVAGWESGRWLSEVERTRNGLAAAVEHERTRFSWVVWRIYIEFEIRVKEMQRAKKLLFRSIGECPLVKELYLVAFGPLRSVFQKHELNALADTMAERGIRLRQGLDEVVGNIGDETEEKEDNERGSDGEDEIEYNAKELRRLMPY